MFMAHHGLLRGMTACLLMFAACGFASQSKAALRSENPTWPDVECSWRLPQTPINLSIPNGLARGTIVMDMDHQATIAPPECRRTNVGEAVSARVTGLVLASEAGSVPSGSARFGVRFGGVDYWGTNENSYDDVVTGITVTIPKCSASDLASGQCPPKSVSLPIHVLARKDSEKGVPVGAIDLSFVPIYEFYLTSSDNRDTVLQTYLAPSVVINPFASTCAWDTANLTLDLGAISPDDIPNVLDVSKESPTGSLTSQGCQDPIKTVRIWMNGPRSTVSGLFETTKDMGAAVELQMRRNGTWTRLVPDNPYDNTPPVLGEPWEFRARLVRTDQAINPSSFDVPIVMVIGYL